MVYSELIFITISISRFSIADNERLAISTSLMSFSCRPINFAHASLVLYKALQYSKSLAILSCLAKQLNDVLPIFAASSLPRLFTNFCTKSGISCFSSIRIVLFGFSAIQQFLNFVRQRQNSLFLIQTLFLFYPFQPPCKPRYLCP